MCDGVRTCRSLFLARRGRERRLVGHIKRVSRSHSPSLYSIMIALSRRLWECCYKLCSRYITFTFAFTRYNPLQVLCMFFGGTPGMFCAAPENVLVANHTPYSSAPGFRDSCFEIIAAAKYRPVKVVNKPQRKTCKNVRGSAHILGNIYSGARWLFNPYMLKLVVEKRLYCIFNFIQR